MLNIPIGVNNMNEIKQIEEWAKERGLDSSNSDKQLIKLLEETGELAEAHNKGWRDKQIDSLGDIFVVITIYALQNGLHIDNCIKEAYNTIKNRTGETVDGVFVKKEDKPTSMSELKTLDMERTHIEDEPCETRRIAKLKVGDQLICVNKSSFEREYLSVIKKDNYFLAFNINGKFSHGSFSLASLESYLGSHYSLVGTWSVKENQ